jgi:hypothetical protein
MPQKKNLLNTEGVFWFSLQLLSETSLILRTERERIKNVYGLNAKYPLFTLRFNETWIFSADFRKNTQNTKIQENSTSGTWAVPNEQTDRQT